jgi:hypothetical protein
VRDLLKRAKYALIEAHDGEAGIRHGAGEASRPDPDGHPGAEDLGHGRDAPIARRRGDCAHADHRDHLVRALGCEQKAKDAGATGYLAKPYSPFDLLKAIRSLLPEG